MITNNILHVLKKHTQLNKNTPEYRKWLEAKNIAFYDYTMHVNRLNKLTNSVRQLCDTTQDFSSRWNALEIDLVYSIYGDNNIGGIIEKFIDLITEHVQQRESIVGSYIIDSLVNYYQMEGKMLNALQENERYFTNCIYQEYLELNEKSYTISFGDRMKIMMKIGDYESMLQITQTRLKIQNSLFHFK